MVSNIGGGGSNEFINVKGQKNSFTNNRGDDSLPRITLNEEPPMKKADVALRT